MIPNKYKTPRETKSEKEGEKKWTNKKEKEELPEPETKKKGRRGRRKGIPE